MRVGLYVLAAFAALWGVYALEGLGAPRWSLVAPALISVVMVLWIAPRIGARASQERGDPKHIRRALIVWIAFEVTGMAAASVVLPIFGQGRLFIPAMALFVALHFLGLAKDLRFPIYYVTGAAMTLTSLVAMLLPGAWPVIAAATAGALILWATILSFAVPPRTPAA